MAPISSDQDLLNDAIRNKARLPSWKSTFIRLSSPLPHCPSAVTSLSNHLCSPASIEALSRCYEAFPPPSSSSKTDFEKRTAPINFTAADQAGPASAASGYALPPIAELKEAALDLSKSLNIGEVEALRIVVLEHQERPAVGLVNSGASDSSTDNVFGGGYAEAQLRVSQLISDEEKKKNLFVRRLEVYLQERRYVIKTATFLVRAAMGAERPENVWRTPGRKFLAEGIMRGGGITIDVMGGIAKRWRNDKDGEGLPQWVKERLGLPEGEGIAFQWELQTVREVIHLLQLLFILFYKSVEESTSLFVRRWFGLMRDTQFLAERNFYPFPNIPDVATAYQAAISLATIVSLTVMQRPRVEQHVREEFARPLSNESSVTPPAIAAVSTQVPQRVSDESFYIEDPEAIRTVNQCIEECAHNPAASVPAFCWSYVVYDLCMLVNEMRGSDQLGTRESRHPTAEAYDHVLSELFEGAPERASRNLARSMGGPALKSIILMIEPTSDASVGTRFWVEAEEDGRRMKNVLAELVRTSLPDLELTQHVLGAVFLLSDVLYNDLASYQEFLRDEPDGQDDGSALGWTGSSAKRFTRHEAACKFLQRVKNRFPFEPHPFLKMVKALATESTSITRYLTTMDTFTQMLPPGFNDYDADDEDTDVTKVQLNSDLLVFAPRKTGLFEEEYSSLGAIVIPAGTLGVIASTGGIRPVVAWQYQYNIFPVLGRVLEHALLSNGVDPGTSYAAGGSSDAVTEIIELLSILIASGTATSVPEEYSPTRVLEEASDLLGRSRDVVSIIFDLLESGLQAVQIAPNAGKSTDFVVAAVQFVDALVPILPGRVWPYLARSTILEQHGRGGAFYGILSAVEVVRGDYEFTITCLKLYEDLVEEAIKSSVVNMGGSKTVALVSMGPSSVNRSGVSVAVQRDILTAWTRVAVDVFESYHGWKYTNHEQKLDIGQRISRIFTNLLSTVYGVDEEMSLESKVTSVLAPSAEHIVAIFLSEGDNELPMEPIIQTILEGLKTPETSFHLRSLNAWVGHVVSVLKFAEVAVRVRGYLNLPPSQLEKQLYSFAASLTKLYVIHDRYRLPVLEILESLVIASGTATTEPPSLLGHFGADCASHFATVLGNLDRPFGDETLESRIWGFVSAVVSYKQQGLSILLIRGETLWQGGLNGRDKEPKKSLLSVALDSLSEREQIPAMKSLAMLEAVALAQNFWSLAMDDLGRHPKFLPGIIKQVESLTVEFLPADSKEILTDKANTIAVVAQIAQILAIHLHSRRSSSSDGTFFKRLMPRLRFYFEQAVTITGYRPSLHGHLQKNFEEKWSGLTLQKLRKTVLQRKAYGTGYYYDMGLAGKVLSFDPSWGGRADGYAREVEQANLNLSLVDSQVVLLRAWILLAAELCDFVGANKELEQPLVDVVEKCLQANIETGLPSPIFTTIVCERTEFAFVVLRQLQQVMKGGNGRFDRILELAWKAIHSSSSRFRHALATADAGYYRSLLRIIYLVLHADASKSNQPTETAYMVLDILILVVARGFEDLATAAHSYPKMANPEDIALVTAILQAALKLKGIEVIHEGLSTHIADNGTIRVATTLYSWAERLSDNGDPVYGELSALFILELSSVPLIAEQLAIEGILELLISGSLSARIRRGVLPTTEPRLHAIWSRGLLPIALNLLAHIGARISREVVAFLAFFAPQLQTTILAWQKRTVVTLSSINEATTVVMIMAILTRMGVNPVTEGLGLDKAALSAEVEYLLGHRNYLKVLVAPTNVEEEELLKKDSGDGQENMLVERVLTSLVVLQGLLAEDDTEE